MVEVCPPREARKSIGRWRPAGRASVVIHFEDDSDDDADDNERDNPNNNDDDNDDNLGGMDDSGFLAESSWFR